MYPPRFPDEMRRRKREADSDKEEAAKEAEEKAPGVPTDPNGHSHGMGGDQVIGRISKLYSNLNLLLSGRLDVADVKEAT